MNKLAEETRKSILLLYKRILNSHAKNLSADMRVFGDYFVKTEFQLHYRNSDEEQAKVFVGKWKLYEELVAKGNVERVRPNPKLYSKLDLDQMRTLNELKETIEKK